MNNTIFLSIIIPVYNGAKVIDRCLNSIWEQGLDESIYEVICINDCSNDNTAEMSTTSSPTFEFYQTPTIKRLEVAVIMEYKKLKENILYLLMQMIIFILNHF